MQLKKEDVLKLPIVSVSEFAKNYAGGVSSQAISYAMEKDKVDYVWLGDERFVVLTDKTKLYSPNASQKRNIIRT
jgi:hypothetical protein